MEFNAASNNRKSSLRNSRTAPFKRAGIEAVAPFINWTYFFHAWKVPGKYDGIETLCECGACRAAWLQGFSGDGRAKAEEALKLFRDAQKMLRHFRDTHSIGIHTAFRIFPARSQDDDIIVGHPDGREIRLPMLRQQQPSNDGYCYSLADFIAPSDDFIGVFACTVQGAEACAGRFEAQGELYRSLLAKTLADRLAEAASEWLHYQVRTRLWGYNPDEALDVGEILKQHYPGIRPAVGYPSLPDQSLIFELGQLINLDEMGITLTENGAMQPGSSVCGLYFAHPKAKYFRIGPIDGQQLARYAARRGKTTEEMRKWVGQLTIDN